MPIIQCTFTINQDTSLSLLQKYRPDLINRFPIYKFESKLTLQYEKDFEGNFSKIRSLSVEEKLPKNNLDPDGSYLGFIIQKTLPELSGLHYIQVNKEAFSCNASQLKLIKNDIILDKKEHAPFRQLKYLHYLAFEKLFCNPIPDDKEKADELQNLLSREPYNAYETVLMRAILHLQVNMNKEKEGGLFEKSFEKISHLGYCLQFHILNGYPKFTLAELITLYIKQLKEQVIEDKALSKNNCKLKLFSYFFKPPSIQFYEETIQFLSTFITHEYQNELLEKLKNIHLENENVFNKLCR